jgi:hypothetical protein
VHLYFSDPTFCLRIGSKATVRFFAVCAHASKTGLAASTKAFGAARLLRADFFVGVVEQVDFVGVRLA